MSEETQVEGPFSADMSIQDAMQLHPKAAEIFSQFHSGGCAHCPVSRYETVRQVCMGHGIEVDEFVNELNSLVTGE